MAAGVLAFSIGALAIKAQRDADQAEFDRAFLGASHSIKAAVREIQVILSHIKKDPEGKGGQVYPLPNSEIYEQRSVLEEMVSFCHRDIAVEVEKLIDLIDDAGLVRLETEIKISEEEFNKLIIICGDLMTKCKERRVEIIETQPVLVKQSHV